MSNRNANHNARITTFDETIPNARILVVDDDDILRGLHEAVLSLHGYGTQSAADGREALGLLETSDFDLVLTDCNIPHLDGVYVVRALRSLGSRIPVVMVSGSLNQEDLPDDIRWEVSSVLPKPARTSDLLAAINHALRTRQTAPGTASIGDDFDATVVVQDWHPGDHHENGGTAPHPNAHATN